MIEATIEGDTLVIRARLQEPTPSATGKTLVVASSHGNASFPNVLVDGQPITIGFNAYIRPAKGRPKEHNS
jgi:hypothetical protein